MTDQHPIIPPRELVRQWMYESNHNEQIIPQVADFAAQWGADQQLDRCTAWLCEYYQNDGSAAAEMMRSDCRPKPPSLKEQALAILDDSSPYLDGTHENIIRRALEALPE